MDISRRKLVASAAASFIPALAGCLDPDEGTAWDIWLGGDEERDQRQEPVPKPDENNGDEKRDEIDENFYGFCDTHFRVPKEGAIYFRENFEVSDGEILEGVISDNGDQTLEIQYLNHVKYLGDEGYLFRDNECFEYSPGGFGDSDHGEWHTRCFEAVHEFEDSYLVETEAVKDVAGPDERSEVPVCVYDSDY